MRIDICAEMSFEPSFEEQELLAVTYEREASRLSARESNLVVLLGTVFVAATAGVWLLRPPHAFALVPALECVLVLALAMLVRFDTPFGFTTATQLGFVPLLFAVPLAVVPIAVVLAWAISALPAIRAGELRPARLLQIPANSFFVFGPVAVFAFEA